MYCCIYCFSLCVLLATGYPNIIEGAGLQEIVVAAGVIPAAEVGHGHTLNLHLHVVGHGVEATASR